jgi:hypothetical protein
VTQEAIDNIQAIFGGCEQFYFTSAETNFGILNMLRDIVWLFVTEDGARREVAKKFGAGKESGDKE